MIKKVPQTTLHAIGSDAGGVVMSSIIGVLVLVAGSVFTVTLMSCFALAKRADERREEIFASLSEDCSSVDFMQ